MRIGILIIGSLLWDRKSERKVWRRDHLDLDSAMPVSAQINYGRRSQSRGNTFTMTINPESGFGRAIIVPCRTTQREASTLFAEAEALWRAEMPDAALGRISASWGCVGARFRDQSASSDWSIPWSEYFSAKVASPTHPVNSDGLLEIPWPSKIADNPIEVDVILATATRAEKQLPNPSEIADAWIDQDGGDEKYFFENVRHGIRTPEDIRIWRRIEERMPKWLLNDAYSEALEVLRAESKSRD